MSTAELHQTDENEDEQATSQRLKEDVMSAFGVFPSPPGLETGDFDDLIEEAMSDQRGRGGSPHA